MGTHRSRHNKGRKPFYKEHRAVAAHLIANPWGGETFRGFRMMQRTWWTPQDEFKLGILCEAESDIEASANVLARQPKTIAFKARDLQLVLPQGWWKLIAQKYKPRERKPSLMAYPYVRTARDEHADLLAVNGLIPKSIAEHMRADICQEILLAVYEGRATIDGLRAKNGNASYYIKKFYHDNYEQSGHAISFQDTNEDWDSDSVASSVAAKEWQRERDAELKSNYESATRTYTPATQFYAAWRDQIGRIQLKHHELGQFLSKDEVEELTESS